MRDDKSKRDPEATIPEDDFWASILNETMAEAEDRLGMSKPTVNSATLPEDDATLPEDDATVPEDGDTLRGDGSAPLAIRKGETLLDTYRVESDVIGKGGMGAVWKVHHIGWDTDLAMKRPKAEAFQTEKQKENFTRECDCWINLGLHPNIVSCYYVRELGGIPTIFSEWMENGDLETHITDGTLYAGTDAEVRERLLDIAIQFARGLHYAHENKLVHQDVKPDNLLLTKDWEAKVSDFGIARARSMLTVLEGEWTQREYDPNATQPTPSGGMTFAYCSPEQAARQLLTCRTDIYSWAVSVLEMYLGCKPWARPGAPTGPLVGLACRDYFAMCTERPIPAAMQKLLAKCLEQNPDDRPRDFGVVEAALLDIYKSETGAAYPRPAPKAAADTADSLNNRALSFLDLGRDEEATRLWERALKADQNNVQSVYNRGLYRWRAGEITDLQLMTELELFTRNTGVPTEEYLAEVRSEQGKAAHLAEESGLEYVGGVYLGAPLYQLNSRDGRYRILRDRSSFTVQDLKTGRTLRRFELNNKYSSYTAPYGCALSGDGKTVCYACDEAYTYKQRIWTGREWAELDSNTHGVRLHICDLGGNTEEVFDAPKRLTNKDVVSLALSPDSRRIYVAFNNGFVTVYNRRGELLVTTEVPRNLRCLYVEPDSGRLAVGGAQLHLLDGDGKLVRSFAGHNNDAQTVFLRGNRLLAADGDVVGVWDTESGKCLCTIRWGYEDEPGYDAAWLDSENNIRAMHGEDLSVFSLAESTLTAGYALSRPQTTAARTSKDERFSALCDAAEKQIAAGRGLEALATLEQVRQIEGYAGNGRLLALNELAGRQCRRLGVRAVYADPVNAKNVHFPRDFFRACLSGDGESVFLNNGYYDNTVSRFSLPDWELRAKSKPYSDEDLLGRACGVVTIAGGYGAVHLLDAESMQLVQSFNYLGGGPKVQAATQMCTGGRWLAVSRKGGTISVFDLVERSHLLDLDALQGDRPILDISEDGSVLLAADSSKRTLRVWRLPSGEELYSLQVGSSGLEEASGSGRDARAFGLDSAWFAADTDRVLLCLRFPRTRDSSRYCNLHELELKTGRETTVPEITNVERIMPMAGRTGWAALSDGTNTVRLFTLQDPASSFSFEPVPAEYSIGLFLSADDEGKYLLFSGTMGRQEGIIKRWRIDWIYGE